MFSSLSRCGCLLAGYLTKLLPEIRMPLLYYGPGDHVGIGVGLEILSLEVCQCSGHAGFSSARKNRSPLNRESSS
jgi:hypothetical protein